MRLTSEFAKVASANGGLSTSARLVGEISDQAASVHVMTPPLRDVVVLYGFTPAIPTSGGVASASQT